MDTKANTNCGQDEFMLILFCMYVHKKSSLNQGVDMKITKWHS